MSFVDTYLEHFGVKGMRWGVRRFRGGVSSRRAKPTPSEDKVKAETAKAKIGKRGNTDALSNDELQTVINRMNKEQALARLLKEQKSKGVDAFIKQKLKETAQSEFQAFSQGKTTKIVGAAMVLGAKGKHRRK